MKEIKCTAIVVAGGSGTRMNSGVKKQFILLDEVPILIHTLKNIAKSNYINKIIVVLPKDEIKESEELIKEYGCKNIDRCKKSHPPDCFRGI